EKKDEQKKAVIFQVENEKNNTENIHETFKKIAKTFNNEFNQLDNMGVMSIEELLAMASKIKESMDSKEGEGKEETKEETKEEIHEEIHEEVKENHHETPNNTEMQKNKDCVQTLDEVEYICANNERMYPFENSNCQWARICAEELWALPSSKMKIHNSPFLLVSDKKHKHLILGKDQSGNLILGIPDMYKDTNRVRAIALGCTDFWACKKSDSNENFLGYWIVSL
ncbi:MAG: hypothetical protein ACRCW1_04700, partial [Anaerotignaceae bacterium]